MNALIAFWKKDIINKLIVLISLGLILGVVGLLVLLFAVPQGIPLGQIVSDVLPAQPSPTFDVNLYLTPRTATVSPYTPTSTPTVAVIVTIPTIPPTEELPSPTFDATAQAASAATLAAAMLSPTKLTAPSPTASLQSTPAGATPTAASPVTGAACIPANARKTGRVVEILDGNTLRVIIDGPTYVVRYIGVGAPESAAFAETARLKNQELAYGKEVTLVPGLMEKDDRGRLLYYVLASDAFLNLEIIRLGYGLALDAPPNNDCLSAFQVAQQQAQSAGLGIWLLPTVTPNP
jgi:micrococcal nuclease